MIATVPGRWPALATAGFLLLTVLALSGAPAGWDAAITDRFRASGAARPDLIDAVRVLTDVAATVPFLLLGAAVTALAAWRLGRPEAIFAAAVTGVVPILWSVMHVVLPHARPADGFVAVESYGYPSGHTSNATALALLVLLLGWPRLGVLGRALLAAGAALFAFGVGLTRVMLVVHWPVQVVGGWLLAAAVVPFLAVLVRRRVAARAR